ARRRPWTLGRTRPARLRNVSDRSVTSRRTHVSDPLRSRHPLVVSPTHLASDRGARDERHRGQCRSETCSMTNTHRKTTNRTTAKIAAVGAFGLGAAIAFPGLAAAQTEAPTDPTASLP